MAQRTTIIPTKLAHLRGHSDSIYDFALDVDNQRIYSAGADGYIVRWTIGGSPDGELVLKGPEAFYSIYLDPVESRLYAGTRSGILFVIDLESAQLIEQKKRHNGGMFFIRKISGQVVTGGEDGRLMVGETTVEISTSSLRSVAQFENRLFVGGSDGIIYVLDTEDWSVLAGMTGHELAVFALEFVDDHHLVSTGRDARIRMWDVKALKEVTSVPAHEYQGKSLSFNGQLLLSSSMDKSIKVWDADLKLLKVIDYARNSSHINCINKVEWLSSDMFVSSSDDRTIMVWQIELNS